MSEITSDLFTGIGLLLTLIGAWIAAHAVILKQAEAIEVGVGVWVGDTVEENLGLPQVQNLLAGSRGARRGLIFIFLGTLLQLVPVGWRLFMVLLQPIAP